eukprot:3047768-Ditylum_brightwellii.AAC.1
MVPVGQLKKRFDLTYHNFGKAQGTQADIQMSTKTLEDGDLYGIICKADITWNHRQTDGQLFGETY